MDIDARLNSPHESDILSALQALGPHTWTRDRLELAIQHAREGEPFITSLVAEMMESVPRELEAAAGKFLIECLSHEDETVRADSAESIGVLGFAAARPKLEDLILNDTFDLVRTDAATALGQLADPDSEGPLRQVARQDEHPVVRGAAATALGRCTNDAPPADAQAWWTETVAAEESPEVKAEWVGPGLRWKVEAALSMLEAMIPGSNDELLDTIAHAIEDLSKLHPPMWIPEDYWPRIEALLGAHPAYAEYHEFVLESALDRLKVATSES